MSLCRLLRHILQTRLTPCCAHGYLQAYVNLLTTLTRKDTVECLFLHNFAPRKKDNIIMANINDMTVGSPARDIIHFAVPLICGYILQQMYLIIDAAIVGQFIGVNALAAVGASSSIMFLIMGFCNGSCAGFAIPVAQEFGAKTTPRCVPM